MFESEPQELEALALFSETINKLIVDWVQC